MCQLLTYWSFTFWIVHTWASGGHIFVEPPFLIFLKQFTSGYNTIFSLFCKKESYNYRLKEWKLHKKSSCSINGIKPLLQILWKCLDYCILSGFYWHSLTLNNSFVIWAFCNIYINILIVMILRKQRFFNNDKHVFTGIQLYTSTIDCSLTLAWRKVLLASIRLMRARSWTWLWASAELAWS